MNVSKKNIFKFRQIIFIALGVSLMGAATLSPVLAAPSPVTEQTKKLDSLLAPPLNAPLIDVSQTITTTKTDDLAKDANGNSLADPGDVLTYTVVITNDSGVAVTNVLFSDTLDLNTVLSGTVKSTPLALPDAYDVVGNTAIVISATNGVLSGNASSYGPDFDPDGGVVTATAVTNDTTDQGGTITILNSGAFTYTPQVAFSGTDTYTYAISDDEGETNSDTITFTVSDMIWWVDNSAAVNGNGRSSSPFNAVPASVGGSGDIIFIYETGSGNYSSTSLTLGNNQQLIGQGVDLATASGITPPLGTTFPTVTSNPTLTSNSNAITLGSGNSLHGLTVGNTTGTGIIGTSVGNLTIRDVTINGTGTALSINGGALDVIFDAVTVASSTTGGVSLQNTTGSTTFDSLNLTTTGGTGFLATSAGTVTVNGSNNVINATNGTAVYLTNTTIGASGATFLSISADTADKGIVLNNTGIGAFTVTGSGSTDGSGGIIQDINDRGIELISAQNINLSNMNLTDAALTEDVASGSATCHEIASGTNTGCNAPIHMVNVSNIDFDNLTINGSVQQGINGNNVNGLEITNSDISNIGAGISPSGDKENGINMINLIGTVTFNNLTVIGSHTRNVMIENDSGTLNLTMQNSTINSAVGEDGFAYVGHSTAIANHTINSSTFSQNHAVQLKTHAEDTSTVDVNITGNTFTGDVTQVGNVGIDIVARDSANITFDVIGTLGTPQVFQPFRSQVINVYINGGGTGSGTVRGNTVNGSAYGAGVRAVSSVTNSNNTSLVIDISDNTISGVQGVGLAGIHVEAEDGVTIPLASGLASVHATISNNIVSTNGADAAIQVIIEDLNTQNNLACANVINNSATAVGGQYGATAFYYGNSPGGVSGFGTAQMQGYTTSVGQAWIGNGNTDNGTIVLGEGTITGGTCNTVAAASPAAVIVEAPETESTPLQSARHGGADAAARFDSTLPVISAPLSEPITTASDTYTIVTLDDMDSRQLSLSKRIFGGSLLAPLAPGDPGEPITMTLGNLPPGKVVIITFQAAIANAPFPAGVDSVVNQAVLSGSNFTDTLSVDPNPNPGYEPDNGETITPLHIEADLAISKTDNLTEILAGETTTYTIVAANLGPNDVISATLTDNFPAEISSMFWTCTAANGAACDTGSGSSDLNETVGLPMNGILTYTVAAVVDASAAAGTLTNTAVITMPTIVTDPITDNNSATDTTEITTLPNLQIDKVGNPTAVAAGDTLTYTLTYTNAGGRNATGVLITDTVPNLTSFNAVASTPGWNCVPDASAGSVCTLNVGALNSGGTSGNATFVVDVDALLPSGTSTITNTATIGDDGANGPDADLSDNSSIETTVVLLPDLTAVKNNNTSDFGALSQPFTWTITIANSGSADGIFPNGSIILVDDLSSDAAYGTPAISNVTGVTNSGNIVCEINALTLTCTASGADVTLDAGSGSFDVAFSTTPSATGTLDNPPAAGQCLVNPDDDVVESNAGNNNCADSVTIQAVDMILVSKNDGDITALPGNTITYTIIFFNGGDLNATGVVLTETVPANTSFNAGASTGGWACSPDANAGSVCTLAIGTVNSSFGSSAIFAVDVDNPLPFGVTQISNTAVIGDDGNNGTDSDPSNSSKTEVTPVNAAPIFEMSKDDGGITAVPGSLITYTLTYTNSGNQQSAFVVITETVPANTTFSDAATTASWSCLSSGEAGDLCTHNVGQLNGGGDGGTVDFVVSVASTVPASVETIENSALMGYGSLAVTAMSTTPLTASPVMALSKDDGGITAVPGDTIAYILEASNTGNQDATGVVLTETVPANTSFNTAASTAGWSCTPDSSAGSTCLLDLSVLSAAANMQVTFAVNVETPLAAGITGITNTALLADDGSNGPSGIGTATTNTPVDAAPDLTISKSDAGTLIEPGDTVTYTLSFNNVGNQDATGVVLTETVPANTNFNSGLSSAGWICIPDSSAGSVCTFPVGALAGGISDEVLFVVDTTAIMPPGVTQIDNSGCIGDDGSNGNDPTPGNNCDSDSTYLNIEADVWITKTVSAAEINPGQVLTYTIAYGNQGVQASTNVIITDIIPAALTNISFSSNPPLTASGGLSYVWQAGSIASGATGLITVTATVPVGVMGELIIENTAVIDGDFDVDPDNNSNAVTTEVQLYKTFLPVVLNRVTYAPDLVVDAITVIAPNNVEIVIRNAGNVLVEEDFWVDLYVNPDPVPTTVNQTWEFLADQGAVWGVSASILPGASLTIHVNDSYYMAQLSNLPAQFLTGTQLYAQVDSAYDGSPVGAILESHEMTSSPYNNIMGPVSISLR